MKLSQLLEVVLIFSFLVFYNECQYSKLWNFFGKSFKRILSIKDKEVVNISVKNDRYVKYIKKENLVIYPPYNITSCDQILITYVLATRVIGIRKLNRSKRVMVIRKENIGIFDALDANRLIDLHQYSHSGVRQEKGKENCISLLDKDHRVNSIYCKKELNRTKEIITAIEFFRKCYLDNKVKPNESKTKLNVTNTTKPKKRKEVTNKSISNKYVAKYIPKELIISSWPFFVSNCYQSIVTYVEYVPFKKNSLLFSRTNKKFMIINRNSISIYKNESPDTLLDFLDLTFVDWNDTGLLHRACVYLKHKISERKVSFCMKNSQEAFQVFQSIKFFHICANNVKSRRFNDKDCFKNRMRILKALNITLSSS